ncbi:MAG: ABC transporter ATP-binding protein [Eubacteriales bacterium]|nr:ABC transporter ATP-binding protein [Eubacteriales bacterium]MDY3333093.1 ABC transporter ATP-binding protein [Gallibacter sp.]
MRDKKIKEKKNQEKNIRIFSRFFTYFGKNNIILAISSLLAITAALFTMLTPRYISDLTDEVQKGIMAEVNMDAVFNIAMILLALCIFSYVFDMMQGLLMARFTMNITKRMRTNLNEKIDRLPMSYFGNNTVGDILSRMTNDVDTLSQSFTQSLGLLTLSTGLFVCSLVMMITTNLIMTLTAIGSSLLGFLFMGIVMSRSQKLFTSQQEYLGELNGDIEEAYTNHLVVKAYCAEDFEREHFSKLNTKLRDTSFKAQYMAGLMMPIMNFIGNFAYLAVCVIGGILALKGSISFGVIIAFMIYVRYFIQPLTDFAQAMRSMQGAIAAGRRIFIFLDEEEMADDSDKAVRFDDIKGKIVFENVSFSYDGENNVINNFSLNVNPGQKIAIVGKTGAGKTTLVNLLMGFYPINSGNIYIDDVSINDVTKNDIHDQFCMVLQDTWIFEGSIYENLVYNKIDVRMDKVVEACRIAGINNFIGTLPKGYDTVLDEHINLSYGQRQQLTIARAIIADKPMLILDEATSSVDTRSEALIQEAMDTLMENRTSFIIAHRLSTIRNADKILVMENGNLVEQGTHKELLDKSGIYANLYNSQFVNSEVN